MRSFSAAGWMLSLLLATAGADELPSASAAERLAEENRRLRSLGRELLLDRSFPRIELRDGTVLESIQVTAILDAGVEIRQEDRTLQIAWPELPASWRLLVEEAAPVVRRVAPRSTGARAPGPEVNRAIVVIEGDVGDGTGFVVTDGGKPWLYTAAHVLSGNRRLEVRTRDGRPLRSFGVFEASEGADLVRLELTEEFEGALTLASSAGRAKQGGPIFAAGNSGGSGTLAYAEGTIQGVGPDSIEIDAEVIQGNSGGPILDGTSHEVLGLVTHLMDGRDDKWSAETRFSDIRRFGCRLDRERKWRALPIQRFLEEGRELKEVQDLNGLMILALSPEAWSPATIATFPEHPLRNEILALYEWGLEQGNRGTGVSDSDRVRRIGSLLRRMESMAKQQLRDFDPTRFVWYHRETAAAETELRTVLIEACEDTIRTLR